MRFGRVQGFLTSITGQQAVLMVTLDDGRSVKTMVERGIQLAVFDQDEAWLVDQLTQEVLGNELALEGWEVIGHEPAAGESDGGVFVSDRWIVRLLG